MAKKERPAAVCAELFGTPEKLVVLDVLLDRNLSLKEIKLLVPHLSEEAVVKLLEELQDVDLVKKFVLPRGKVEYGTSMVGDTLEPVFEELRKWGEGYQRMVDAYISR